jgi:metallophosphoesterase superfamily enzyme
MEFSLTKNIKIIDLCLLTDKTLIISDIHVGYEEELNKNGILIPRLSFKEIGKRLEKIMNEVKDKIDTMLNARYGFKEKDNIETM